MSFLQQLSHSARVVVDSILSACASGETVRNQSAAEYALALVRCQETGGSKRVAGVVSEKLCNRLARSSSVVHAKDIVDLIDGQIREAWEDWPGISVHSTATTKVALECFRSVAGAPKFQFSNFAALASASRPSFDVRGQLPSALQAGLSLS